MTNAAGQVEIEGIWYVLESNTKTASVVSNPNGKYSGFIYVPESVTYGEVTYSVTSIGKSAFDHCFGFASITIPNSVTSIGEGSFDGCSGLTSVVVKRETPVNITSNVFTNRDNATLYVPQGCTPLTKQPTTGRNSRRLRKYKKVA